MKMKLKVGDEVEVICGNDRKKRGSVIRVESEKCRVVVSGVCLRKKCIKKSSEHQEGAIVDVELPIHYSNVRKVSSQ
ncbi:MAG: 50S ribosomal protein L24 [Puniceicoccales bacterium]|jgi:large subunit ribosomal protein L24|nr:50S ribosomal protein L24 [Puniceicoccales bacterium]